MECLQLRKPIQTGRREDFQVVKQIKDGVVNKADLQKINHKKSETVIFLAQVHSFIHSFIHSGVLYSASSRDFYSEALPAQSRTKKKDFREMSNLEGWAISKERNSKGRSFHADGPTTEKVLRCIIAKRARGTKNSPLAAERSTRRAAKTDTGQQRTRRQEGAQPRTQRETIAVIRYCIS